MTRSSRAHARRAQPVTYQVRVDLDGAKPPIWRRLLLSSELMLDELHLVLQRAMGWDDSHLHEFLAGKNRVDPFAVHYVMQYMLDDGAEDVLEDQVRLDELLTGPKDRLFYGYDFGDRILGRKPRHLWRGEPIRFVAAGRSPALKEAVLVRRCIA